jgi:hypothetical protein
VQFVSRGTGRASFSCSQFHCLKEYRGCASKMTPVVDGSGRDIQFCSPLVPLAVSRQSSQFAVRTAGIYGVAHKCFDIRKNCIVLSE